MRVYMGRGGPVAHAFTQVGFSEVAYAESLVKMDRYELIDEFENRWIEIGERIDVGCNLERTRLCRRELQRRIRA